MDYFLGTIVLWPMSWAPVGWAFCDGRLLSINEYEALFSLIGTSYGGNGVTNFGLPNFQGYIAVGAGASPLGNLSLGNSCGSYSTNTVIGGTSMPSHGHAFLGTCEVPSSTFPIAFQTSANEGDRNMPQDNDYLSATTRLKGRPVNLYRGTLGTEATLSGIGGTVSAKEITLLGNTSVSGHSRPIEVSNVQKSFVLNYIIAVTGLYPDRP
ncbi:phage tail protein [Fusibacter sp. 3D3]|uniref:phage tail protein n=1 Tax=Fusibacter sp. 3D3 TaxID=1048380 RepID=UPI000852BB69|nr:tail fiber protein [Fusibacter sp. 3D3]GAU78718.1 microcystin dependent protein [Fusibacter sp. 3D3]